MGRLGEPAVVLLSGGLDSTTTLAVAAESGYVCYALTFDYGQRHRHELTSARAVAASCGVRRHEVVEIDLRAIGGSALTGDLPLPKGRDVEQIGAGIPATYVPARNTIFLSFALAWAEVLGSSDIFIGVNAVDYSGYPDCRPEFIAAFERLANLATKAGVERTSKFTVHAPLIAWTKAEIIREGTRLGVDYGLTHTCYDPNPQGVSCGRCDACVLRRKGFHDAGLQDPLTYQT